MRDNITFTAHAALRIARRYGLQSFSRTVLNPSILPHLRSILEPCHFGRAYRLNQLGRAFVAGKRIRDPQSEALSDILRERDYNERYFDAKSRPQL